jgi:hypothetical protein
VCIFMMLDRVETNQVVVEHCSHSYTGILMSSIVTHAGIYLKHLALACGVYWTQSLLM